MKEGRLSALLPIGVFLLLFLGSGIFFADFYKMPAIVAFLLAFMVAFIQNGKHNFMTKLGVATRSMGQENIMLMCMIFILAGAFSGIVQAAGGVSSTVNFSLAFLPPALTVSGLYLIACFISISMGTSVGTIAALAPIAIGISDKTTLPVAMCLGAVVCGAMFGDNLSVISDTTIAATKTQGCKMTEKFRENFRIVLPAAILTFIFFSVLGVHANYTISGDLEYSFVQMLPYLVILFGAAAGINVFLLLFAGIILSGIVGVATGMIQPDNLFVVVASGNDGHGGVMGMYDIMAISLVVAGIIGLVKENGGIDYLLSRAKQKITGKKQAQLGIAALSSLVDIATANNTVAIVIAGPIVKELSEAYDIKPARAASLIDIFTSVWQGVLPYGAQLLYATAGAMAAGHYLTPVAIWPYLIYPLLMFVCGILYILIKGNK